MMRVLDLFSGIGGFSLGLERTGGFQTIAFCEIEPFPRAVLRKHWPEVPIFEDVRKLKGDDVGPVDVICGGYPCQPFSTAGRRRGAEDDRHLWPEFSRLVAELRPTWVCGENVSGHISMGLDDVLSDLEGQGYACRAFVVPACAVDAPHRRDRVWVVGHSRSAGRRRREEPAGRLGLEQDALAPTGRDEGQHAADGSGQDVAHAEKLQRDVGGEHRQQGGRQVPQLGEHGGAVAMADADNKRPQGRAQAGDAGGIGAGRDELAERCADLPGAAWKPQSTLGGVVDGLSRELDGCRWAPEPPIGRVATGVPQRVDRLKALGNAVVPQIPEMIGRAILEAEASA